MSGNGENYEFWREFVSLLLQLACLIERHKMGHDLTNAEYRQKGKEMLGKPCMAYDSELTKE